MARKKGKFFVFEGLDGSGQSTQAKLLKEYFTNIGRPVIVTKEPTLESEAGKKIRKVLDGEIKVLPKELQELFVEDRREHLKNLIVPALEEEKIVISDRYFFSTIAYGALNLDMNWLIEINQDFLLPDATFLLAVKPEACIERIKTRGEGFKFFEKLEKLKRVWETYKILPQKFANIYLIDGEKSILEVHQAILSKLREAKLITT